MCRSCQNEIDRSIKLMGEKTRVRLRVSAANLVAHRKVAPCADMCAALLLRSRLQRLRKCLCALGVTSYGATIARIDTEMPRLCADALACM